MRTHSTTPSWLRPVLIGVAVGAIGVGAFLVDGLSRRAMEGRVTDEGLFNPTQIHTIHLRFTPENWKAMEPVGGNRGFGPPGGGLGRGPGRRGFSPGSMLAPAFMGAGDSDGDSLLTPAELSGLGRGWLEAWAGDDEAVDSDELNAGLEKVLGEQDSGPRGGGGRPGGFNLTGAKGKRNGLASMMGIEFPTVTADMVFNGAVYQSVSIRFKGNGTFMQSRGSLKRSMKIDINDGFPGRKLAGVTKLNLHSQVTDAGWMNEALGYRLYRDAGVTAPRTSYARVFLTVPGEHDETFVGLYLLTENPDNNFAVQNWGTKKGAIFKPVTRQPFEFIGEDWESYEQAYDPKTPISTEEVARVIEFGRFVSQADDADFAARISEFIDIDQFARYMAVTVWLSTMDSILGMGQNYLAYLHPVTGRFEFLPWDLDHAFGQFGLVGSQEQREQLDILHPWHNQVRLVERVYNVPAFRERYLEVMTELSETVFDPERIAAQVDEIAAAIRDDVARESENKLRRFDSVVAGRAVSPQGFGGGPGFGSATPPLRAFVETRADSVKAQLSGESDGLRISGGMFGGGGPGGPPGGGRGRRGPGGFLGMMLMGALDGDNDGSASKTEFTDGFDGWFAEWDADNDGAVSNEELESGMGQTFSPGGPGGFRGGPGRGGFGPPPGFEPPSGD